ncbi:MAG: hypothetical protein ABR577_04490 [Pyrinomonadaceae bacterium]
MILREMMDMKVAEQANKETTQTFIDAGFDVETVDDSITVYSRPVSNDVREASRVLTKRTIGYTSKDITGRENKRF